MSEQRRAVVTGATGGIGSAIVARLAHDRWELYITGRDDTRLRELAARSGARAVACDFADPGVETVLERLVPPDLHLVVHAAGDPPHGRALALTDEAWEHTFRVRLLGALRLVRACVPRFAEGASVVLIAGQAGLQPTSEYGLGAVNAALCHLSKSLALDLAPRVRVNAINPGPTDTPRLRRRLAGRSEESITSEVPLARLVQPSDIAEAVVYLAGAAAITGEVLSVSGGRGARRL